MAKTIFAGEGFRLTDIMSEDGVFFNINNDFTDFNEYEYDYNKNIFMSHDDLMKFLIVDELDFEETNENQILSPLGVNFNKLRQNMTDLLGNGMVMKYVRQEGVGQKMSENAQVTAKYIGYFEDQEEPFDASYNHEATNNLQLGNEVLIPGLEIALRSMKKHEIAIFLIQPEYAYGKNGCPPRIPPNQEVLFLIHVVDFKDDDFTVSFNKLSIEERRSFIFAVRRADALLAKANDCYSKGKITQAINQYSSAAKILEFACLANEEEEIKQKALLTRIFGNLAVCFNKQNKPRCACSAINQIPTPNAKSHFHHGRALIRLGEFDRAIRELMTSKKMDPTNKTALEEIKLAKQLEKEYNSLMRCLKDSSFLTTAEGDVTSEFTSTVETICQKLQSNDNVMRVILPNRLTPDEMTVITALAANYKLIVVNHKRFEKEVSFIAKPNY